MNRVSANHGPGTVDVLGLGEVLVQLVAPADEDLEGATRLLFTTAGAESNVVCHLARMGHRAAMASAVGADPWGARVLRDLHDAGVDTSLVTTDPDAATGIYLKERDHARTRVYYHRAGSAASRMGTDAAEAALASRPAILHTSGIVPALSVSCEELSRRLVEHRGAGTRISFDVNYRAPLWSRESAAPILLDLARRSDIVFVGRDEAERLWGASDDGQIRSLIPEPEFLVVKDDDREAVEWQRDRRTAVRPAPVDIVEPVGAGDAFAAGWLSSFLDRPEGDPSSRLSRGHDVAALVLGSVTDQPSEPDALRRVRGARRTDG